MLRTLKSVHEVWIGGESMNDADCWCRCVLVPDVLRLL